MHRLNDFKELCKQYTKEEFLEREEESVCYKIKTDVVCDNCDCKARSCSECITDFCETYNIEFKDINSFTKDDLKIGMIVEINIGNKYLVMDNNKLLSKYGWMNLTSYNNDLEFETIISKDEDWDIVRVFRSHAHRLPELFQNDKLELIWERQKVKEMTLAEIEKELGYKIKLKK